MRLHTFAWTERPFEHAGVEPRSLLSFAFPSRFFIRQFSYVQDNAVFRRSILVSLSFPFLPFFPPFFLEHQINATVAVIDDRKASKAIIGYK